MVDLHLCRALASLMVYVHHDFVFMNRAKQRRQTKGLNSNPRSWLRWRADADRMKKLKETAAVP